MDEPSLLPVTSAAHGITFSQNVSRAVAARIDEMKRGVGVSRLMAWGFVLGPAALNVAVFAAEPIGLVFSLFASLYVVPIGMIVHRYRRKALREAETLDRARDVAWVSGKDGLVFFSDEGVYVEKRGGFRPYGVETRRFTDVTFASGTLILHGCDMTTGARYSLDVVVPSGWLEEDTRRVREKLDRFRF